MKRITAILVAILLVFVMTACGSNYPVPNEDSTVGEHLLYDFRENADKTPQEIADILLANPIIEFMGATMPVEEGYLNGFDNAEIKGFKEGVMFAPAMGTIPFVGYIFVVDESTDIEVFKQTLSDNANLRWNICTEADELIVESEGNYVFFLMCPQSFEAEENVNANIDEDIFDE